LETAKNIAFFGGPGRQRATPRPYLKEPDTGQRGGERGGGLFRSEILLEEDGMIEC